MIKIIVVGLERILFNLTGVELPTLRKEWKKHADIIQYGLDLQHNTCYSRMRLDELCNINNIDDEEYEDSQYDTFTR